MPKDRLVNPVQERLKWIHQQLLATHSGNRRLSSATKGRERESFLDLFLRNCVPPPFRFGSGDIVDHKGSRSGQVDVVIETPIFPSLPLVGGTRERLYLIEGVSAVIEVKSDFSKQWKEVLDTARAVDRLTPVDGMGTVHESPFQRGAAAIIGVGYSGWRTPATLHRKMASASHLDAVLQLSPLMYVQRRTADDGNTSLSEYRDIDALGMFLLHLAEHLRSIVADYSDMSIYFRRGAG